MHKIKILLSLCVKEHLIQNYKMQMKTTSSLSFPEYVLFKYIDVLKREEYKITYFCSDRLALLLTAAVW